MLVIVTPGEVALLSLADTKAAVGVDGDTLDAELEELRLRVGAAIARACKVRAAGVAPPTLRREVLRQTMYLPGQTDELVLARRPLVAIASISIDGAGLTADDYEADEAAGIVYRLSAERRCHWPCSARIVVQNTAGWDVVPAELRLAAAKTSLIFWSENGPDPVDPSLKREKVDGVGEIERWVGPADDPALPAEVMDLLAQFVEGGIS